MNGYLERLHRIRLPARVVARRAGVNVHTVHRALEGLRDTRSSKARAILSVIEAEERALLDHLRALHPEPAASAAPSAPLPAPFPARGERDFLAAE